MQISLAFAKNLKHCSVFIVRDSLQKILGRIMLFEMKWVVQFDQK
jgi:hypothetical protein